MTRLLAVTGNAGEQMTHAAAFNATTSAVDLHYGCPEICGTQKPFTVMAYARIDGAGENQFGYLIARTPSASTRGLRLFHDVANKVISFAMDSSGAANWPQTSSLTNSFPTSSPYWFHIVGTYTGLGVTKDQLGLFAGIAGATINELEYWVQSTDGSGTITDNSSDKLFIGNRNNSDRTWNGLIAYIAYWNRVLSLDDMRRAQSEGPLSVPLGLYLCWSGGRDYSKYAHRGGVMTDILMAQGVPNPRLGPTLRVAA